MSPMSAQCPRCDTHTQEGPVKDPWICSACCAEASGSVRIRAHPTANVSWVLVDQSGWQFGSGSNASAPARPVLEIWADGLEQSAATIRDLLRRLDQVPGAAQVAAELMGKELTAHADANTQRLMVSGLLPHVARRLVEEFDEVEGPTLDDAELLVLMAKDDA